MHEKLIKKLYGKVTFALGNVQVEMNSKGGSLWRLFFDNYVVANFVE